jgi:hypothetical protein
MPPSPTPTINLSTYYHLLLPSTTSIYYLLLTLPFSWDDHILRFPCRSITGRWEAPGSIAVSPPVRSQNLAAGHLHLPGGLSTSTDFNGPLVLSCDLNWLQYANIREYGWIFIREDWLQDVDWLKDGVNPPCMAPRVGQDINIWIYWI